MMQAIAALLASVNPPENVTSDAGEDDVPAVARDHGGPFTGYDRNRDSFLRVMHKHRDAVGEIHAKGTIPTDLHAAAKQAWDEAVELGEDFGYRNAQATVLAPTGTIGFMMDCDTTGVEPDIALVKYKKLVGGGLMKIVNGTVPMALKKLGYTQPEVDAIVHYIDEHETIEGAPFLKDEHLPVFDCAFKARSGTRSIHWRAHVTMMAAAQPFLSGAISKTVNLPNDATVDDVRQIYEEGWRLGLKAVALDAAPSVKTHPARAARVALLHSWQSTQTEGWWRIALDFNKVPYDYVDPEFIGKNTNLREKYDVILVGPGVTQAAIDGQPMWGNATPWKNSPDTPSITKLAESDDTRVGMQLEGLLNLRNFGVQRTLILLDGHRVPGSNQDGTVDVDTLPQMLMSRVDVVTGGASAVYGSDAVAGVVNFILDKKFTGIKGEVSGGVTGYGDARNWKINISGGNAFAGDRGHFLFSGEATHADPADGKPF